MGCPVQLFLADGDAGARINAFGQRLHCDAAVNRANNRAKIAADALIIDDLEFAFAIYDLRDCLVRCILSDNVTTAALDAQILIDHGLLDVIEIQVLPVSDTRDCLANQFAD